MMAILLVLLAGTSPGPYPEWPESLLTMVPVGVDSMVVDTVQYWKWQDFIPTLELDTIESRIPSEYGVWASFEDGRGILQLGDPGDTLHIYCPVVFHHADGSRTVRSPHYSGVEWIPPKRKETPCEE